MHKSWKSPNSVSTHQSWSTRTVVFASAHKEPSSTCKHGYITHGPQNLLTNLCILILQSHHSKMLYIHPFGIKDNQNKMLKT